jgi:hypothetical protein
MQSSSDIHDLVEPRHHRAEILFGLAAFLFAVFLATRAGSELSWDASRSLFNQPGFWPLMAIAGMILCGAFELFFSWRRNATGKGESVAAEVGMWLKSLEYAGWFMAYVLATPYLGYLPTTLLFCLLLTVRLGYRRKRMLIASLLVGLATVVVFKSLLAVKIPSAAVYELLPAALRNFMILYL